MAVTQTVMPMTFIGTTDGQPPTTLECPEAASAGGFKAGDIVIMTSGQISKAGDGPTGKLVGIVNSDASGVENTLHTVFVFDGRNIFRANVYHATPASSKTAYANLFVAYGLKLDSNGIWRIDLGDTANAICFIRAFPFGHTPNVGDWNVGDTHGFADFMVTAAKRAAAV